MTQPPHDSAARLGIAGINSHPLMTLAADVTGTARLGVAGNYWSSRTTVNQAIGVTPEKHSTIKSTRIADNVAAHGPHVACVFSDWTYLLTLQRATGQLRYLPGREEAYAPSTRRLPLLFDCGSFRAFSGAKDVPDWSTYAHYKQAIALVRPDGYASYDLPGDRARSMDLFEDLCASFPQDVDTRIWPVFSARWVQPDHQGLDRRLLPPSWTRLRGLHALVPKLGPVADTEPWKQRMDREAARAVAQAIAMHRSPDFQRLLDRCHGRIMIGGLNKGKYEGRSPIDRPVRHLIAAMLHHLNPGAHIWLLGQASYVVINALGMLGELPRTSVDGTWYIKDGMADRWAEYSSQSKLIYINEVGQGTDQYGNLRKQSFFRRAELFACNLRSLLAAYAGLCNWPDMPRPLDMRDHEQVVEFKRQVRIAAQQLPFDFGVAV